MRLIGILSWYEESASWLAATITSMARAGVQHLVALDGAYAIFPGGRAKSGAEQHAVIVETAHACGLGLTLHCPQEPWLGNEVEKRSFGFQLAEQIAEPGVDWYFLMDADQVVTTAPGMRAALAESELDVAEASFWQRYDPHAGEQKSKTARRVVQPREYAYPVRCLFRALPGLRVVGNHYTYETADGRKLWGNAVVDDLEPALVLSQVRIEHRTDYRDLARKQEQRAYYERRDRLGIETRPCVECGERASETGMTDLDMSEQGLGFTPVPVCADCAPALKAAAEATMRAAGYEPSDFTRELAYPVQA